MKILLYGGTFDPPHIGHLNNLRASLAAVRPDRAIVMPAGTPPHKAASATPAALRLAMCRCFAAVDPRVEISDWEIRAGGRSYTVNTLEMLREQNPGAALYLCVGSDMLNTFTEWNRWQDILRLAALVVQSRAPGDGSALQAAAQALRAQGGAILFAAAPAVPCASSAIRAGQYTPAQLGALLPECVRAIIRQNNLYGLNLPTGGVGMTIEEAKKMVKGRLSAKRYRHTLNVKKMAVQLAERYGADPEKAALAAILHDSAKELPDAELLQIFKDNAIIADNAETRPTPIWHGIAAAILAQTQWGVTDPDILSAIRCHTTGKVGMGLLDKILYLADMTSAERDYPGVEELRREEMENLDLALCHALERSMEFVQEKGAPLDPESVAALQDARRAAQCKG